LQLDKRFIVGISGASGSIYGVRLLEMLQQLPHVQTHLVVTEAGHLNLQHELGISKKDVELLADIVHSVRNIGASIASGSFLVDGMVVAPCSMRTLAATANGLSDNLITRAADVMLKERRRLILMVRESPLNLAHLRNMVSVTEMGGIIYPPTPSFYQRPDSIDAIVNYSVSRVIDLLGLSQPNTKRWNGLALGEDAG
jgi:4-hydroxy-3-polyprenylbenzoate decarboxylase